MNDSSQYPFAELDAELHECALPRLKWGRVYSCEECGCIWEAIMLGFGGARVGLRWALARDPDRLDNGTGD